MNMFDSLTGAAGDEPPARPKNRLRTSTSNRTFQPRTSTRNATRNATSTRSPSASNTQPPEVTDNQWAFSLRWIELGTETTGSRPPVNRAEFAKRLAKAIWSDLAFKKILDTQGTDRCIDVVEKMIEIFWATIPSQTDTPLQFLFFDSWESLRYAAETSVTVARLQAEGSWSVTEPASREDRREYEEAVNRAKVQAFLATASTEPDKELQPLDRDAVARLRNHRKTERN